MERLYRGHLKDREESSHSHKGIKTDRDTMIELDMSGVEKTLGEGGREREMQILW